MMRRTLGAAAVVAAAALAAVAQGPDRKVPAVLVTPAEAVKLAAADAAVLLANYEKLAAGMVEPYQPGTPEYDEAKGLADELLRTMYDVRYLSLHNVPPDQRPEYVKLIDFTLNSLSRRKTMVYATPLAGCDNVVVRVVLREFKIPTGAWDTLGRKGSGPVRSVKKIDQPDPYFHAVVTFKKYETRKVPGKVHAKDGQGRLLYYVGGENDGKPYMVDGTVDEKVAVDTAAELRHAPWLDAGDVEALAKMTYTDFPILRADWFIRNALLAPAYNEFFGFKKLGDVRRTARLNDRDGDLAVKGIVCDSDEVAIHQRAAEYTPTSAGGYYETYDYLTSVNEDNLLEDLKLQRRDASEVIFSLLNGLQGYALVNDSTKNDVIDFADPHVAQDTRTKWRVKTVWTAMSCITCHTDGIKPVTDEVRLLANEKVQLLVRRYPDFQDVVDKFSTPFEEPVQRGQAQYTRAVNLATRGWTPKVLSAKLAEAFLKYEQETLGVDEVAMECGYRPEQVAQVVRTTKNANHTFAQLFSRRPVRRDQWDAKGYGQMMLTLRTVFGQRPAPAVPPVP